ncbi:MAG TPA: GNAT family N-acetyltransferase [Rhodanobacteraceae bacterium]
MTTPAQPVIRPAEPADLDALVALEEATFDSDRLSRRQYRAHIRSASAVVLTAWLDERLAGAAVVFFRRGSHTARLYSLATAAAARGRGVGRALLDAVLAQARRRGCDRLQLEVRTDNAPAIALYEHTGFDRFGMHRGYYADGCDAWRYARNLA